MQARLSLNLFLLVLVTVLTVYLLSTEAPEQSPYLPVANIDTATVREIRLARPGKADLLIQNTGTDWQIISPVNIAANPFRVSSLLAFLQIHSISRVTISNPEAFGLSDADNTVTLTFNDQVFRFGDTNPLDQSRYIEHNNTVHLIEDTLYQQLLQDAAFFASNRLLAGSAQLLKIRTANLELDYLDHVWQQAGVTNRLTEADITELVERWQQLEATRVSTAVTKPTSVADIVLEADIGNRIELVTIALTPELLLYRYDAGILYHFPAELAADLGITLRQD